MEKEHREIRILSHKGERIDSIMVVNKYHGYFFTRERIGARDSKADFILSFSGAYLVFSYLKFTQKEIAEVLEVSPSTLFRWMKSTKEVYLRKLQSKAVLYIDEVIAKGVKLFGSDESFKAWLSEPNYAFGSEKPKALLKDPYEVEKVDNAIEAMSWGNLM